MGMWDTEKSQNAIKVHSHYNFIVLWALNYVVKKVKIMAENGFFW